jgi:hypothetical protein
MKYAFIALIACYLLVYGCGPDNSKKTEGKKDQAVHSTVEKPGQPEQQPKPTITSEEAAKQQPAPVAVDTPPQAAEVGCPSPCKKTAETVQQLPAAEQGAAPVNGQKEAQQESTGVAAQQGPVELTQQDNENIVIMPCGSVFVKHRQPANGPCLTNRLPPCPMMDDEDGPATEGNVVMMPCGRMFLRQPLPDEDLDVDQQQPMLPPDQGLDDPAETREDSVENLTSAVERMVETTNDMVLVTKELVVATREMLKATQKATHKDASPAKEGLEAGPSAQPTQPMVGNTAMKPAPRSEQEAINAMQQAVIATQKALEAMNQAAPQPPAPQQ